MTTDLFSGARHIPVRGHNRVSTARSVPVTPLLVGPNTFCFIWCIKLPSLERAISVKENRGVRHHHP